jgi:uncharacterized protein (TIGR03083 family)
MGLLSYARYCTEIVTQAELLRGCLDGADLTTPVPSCPGWNVGQLVRHLGGAHREAETLVRTLTPPTEDDFRDPTHYTDGDPAALGGWLVDGATALAAALRTAGPETQVATPVADGTTKFSARRMTHETVIHRADATLALGAEFVVDEEVAIDGLDEWMELGALPLHFEVHPWMRELLGPGRTLHFHATDIAPAVSAEWLVDLTGDVIVWRRAHEKAAVAVRAPLADLLLIIYKRRPVLGAGVEIIGEEKLLDFWLERVSFG